MISNTVGIILGGVGLLFLLLVVIVSLWACITDTPLEDDEDSHGNTETEAVSRKSSEKQEKSDKVYPIKLNLFSLHSKNQVLIQAIFTT